MQLFQQGQRAKELNQGEPTDLDKENDKNTVIALREIAQEKISLNYLKIELIKSFQKNIALLEEIEEDVKELLGKGTVAITL